MEYILYSKTFKNQKLLQFKITNNSGGSSDIENSIYEGGIMPRKKLTKTQVKRELGKIQKSVGKLFIDKVDHTGSSVPMGVKKSIRSKR